MTEAFTCLNRNICFWKGTQQRSARGRSLPCHALARGFSQSCPVSPCPCLAAEGSWWWLMQGDAGAVPWGSAGCRTGQPETSSLPGHCQGNQDHSMVWVGRNLPDQLKVEPRLPLGCLPQVSWVETPPTSCSSLKSRLNFSAVLQMSEECKRLSDLQSLAELAAWGVQKTG